MNWLECPDVEAVPGKMGGRPVIKGTRIEPDLIVVEEQYNRSPEQTNHDFPSLSVDVIKRVRAFIHSHQLQP